MSYIAVLPGDGIGPEVINEAIKIIKSVEDVTGNKYDLEYGIVGGEAIDKFGIPLTEDTIKLIENSKAVLFGAVGGPKWDGLSQEKKPENGLLRLRESLGLFSNLRPATVYKPLAGASSLKEDIIIGSDILVVRELTGGIYFGKPRGYNQEEGYNTLRYTRVEVERIAKVAFELAEKRNGHVTSVDKANVLDSSQFWRNVIHDVHQQYNHISLKDMYVDNAAMQLVRDPKQFDVIVTQNMFGDILSDITAMITGSLGMLPSASVGENHALYEPVHGTAPEIAGQNKANPIAMISSVAMMLEITMDHPQAAKHVIAAIESVLNAGFSTSDIASDGSTVVSTTGMRDRIIESFKNNIEHAEAELVQELVKE